MGMVACPATAWPLSTTCIPTTHQASTRPRAWPPHQASSPSSAATTTVTAAVRPQRPVSDKAPHTHKHTCVHGLRYGQYSKWKGCVPRYSQVICFLVMYLFISFIHYTRVLLMIRTHGIELNWIESNRKPLLSLYYQNNEIQTYHH